MDMEWIPEDNKVDVLNRCTEVIEFWGSVDEDGNRINTIEGPREAFTDNCHFQGAPRRAAAPWPAAPLPGPPRSAASA